jgi:hypothetical protein
MLCSARKARTVRLIEIAELLGVIHQRTSVIVRPAGVPRPGRPRGQIRLWDRREVVTWAKGWRREKSSC